MPSLIQFGKDRSKSIIAQLNGEQPSTSYGTIETDLNLFLLGTMGGQEGRGPKTTERKTPMEEKFDVGEDMLTPEIMEQVMEIMRNSIGDELTDREKTRYGFKQNKINNQNLIIICCFLLLIGLIFAIKFNRRK